MSLLLALFYIGAASGFIAPRSATKARYSFPEEHLKVPHHYIISFHGNHSLQDHYTNIGLDVSAIAHEFSHWEEINSYHAVLPEEASEYIVHELIRHDPGVALVEHNELIQWAPIFESEEPVEVEAQERPRRRWEKYDVKRHRWNMRMITSGKKEDLGTDLNTMHETWLMENAGLGVNVYVMDTGIWAGHEEFNVVGKMTPQRPLRHFGDLRPVDKSPYCNDGSTMMDDSSGHGTHVAGIIGTRNGVAPWANLINVKIGCKNTINHLAQAFLDIVKEHNAIKANESQANTGWRGSVINISMGFKTNSDTLTRAVRSAANAGIPIAAAAGNFGEKELWKPAAYKSVMSVGAVNMTYQRWIGRSGGTAHNSDLGIFAPGVGVTSLSSHEADGMRVLTGTSQASPHVAGFMAIIVGYEGYSKLSSANDVYARIRANQIDEVVSDPEIRSRGTPLHLLQTGMNGGRSSFQVHPYDGIPRDEFKRAVPADTEAKKIRKTQDATYSKEPSGSCSTPTTLPSLKVEKRQESRITYYDDPHWHSAPTVTITTDLEDIKPTNAPEEDGDDGVLEEPTDDSGSTEPAPVGQQIALASYIHPSADLDAWTRMLAMDRSKVSLLVANVLNGPDAFLNPAWQAAIVNTTLSGKRIIGYVRTGYLGVSEQGFKTRLGSRRLSDWVAQIEQDVDMWYKLYPGIGGIFFDEGWNECGPPSQPESTVYADLYNYINWNTKRKYPSAYTVLNPGDWMPRCFENSSDTLLTFESSYARYTNEAIYNKTIKAPWTAKDPRKNWHIVYEVPQGELVNVASLAQKRGAGIIELLNTVMPNPYDHLPDTTYMRTEIDAVEGSDLRVENPPLQLRDAGGSTDGPRELTVEGFDYTSVSLSWTSIGSQFEVFFSGGPSFYFPGDMNKATIGGLDPGKSYTFQVNALTVDRRSLTTTNAQTVTTKALPGGGVTVTDQKVTNTKTDTTVTAQILVPYAFTRLYFWDATSCDFAEDPGWPVNWNADHYVCAKYMVENESVYKYNGPKQVVFKNADWAWTKIGTANITTDGYLTTWNVGIGSDTFDTKRFVIQAEGYGPSKNVFSPDPENLSKEFECSGSSMCSSTPEIKKWCDIAVNTLQRNNDLTYGTAPGMPTGNCEGDGVRACGVFIQGDNCKISGNDLWQRYQDLHTIGRCQKCGVYKRSDGCLIKADYVSSCNKGPDSPWGTSSSPGP